LLVVGRWAGGLHDAAMVDVPPVSGMPPEIGISQQQQYTSSSSTAAVSGDDMCASSTLKDRLRQGLNRSEYDVRSYYKTEGCCQAVARAQRFESLTLAVISFNALWISIDVDYNKATTVMDA